MKVTTLFTALTLKVSLLYFISKLFVCVFFFSFHQSEEDFLEESDFDDISIHSASVLSDTLGAATKKKARRGRKKRKSVFTVCVLFSLQNPTESPLNQNV